MVESTSLEGSFALKAFSWVEITGSWIIFSGEVVTFPQLKIDKKKMRFVIIWAMVKLWQKFLSVVERDKAYPCLFSDI